MTLLDAEADHLCGARRYERSEARRDTRAGSYERQLQTKAGEVRLTVLLAGLGAVLGLLLTFGGIRLLHAALDISAYTRSWELRIDLPTLMFTLTLSFATTILFGLWSALKFSKIVPGADLKEVGRSGSLGRSRIWSWKALVSAEIRVGSDHVDSSWSDGKEFC